ncbi:MAG: NAD-binding protein [Anaerolineae bacterium]|nr:NAD-binding protein [Anaerolineae bacterium]
MHKSNLQKRWGRSLRRDLYVFARLFPWRTGIVLGGGIALMAWAYLVTYNRFELDTTTYIKAVYAILNMLTFQVSFADMPASPKLDIFYVIVPLVGIPLLLVFGANVLDGLRILFVRMERGQRWQVALAATIDRPIVVCGLGRVGYRVAEQLLDLEAPVIGVEAVASPLVDALLEREMPVIIGDVRNREVLRSAGVERAPTVLVCTHDDLANIEAAFHVRSLNSKSEVVLRLFEDEIAQDIQDSFKAKAILSRSAIAAQAFAYAAMGLEVLEVFDLDGTAYFLARVPLSPHAPQLGQPLGRLADDADVTPVCLARDGQLMVEPSPETLLRVGDALFVFAAAERLNVLAQSQDAMPHHRLSPIFVCGLGHAGYRVVDVLLGLGRKVVGLDFESTELTERLVDRGVPVFYGDFRQRVVLEQAGIRGAVAIITCTGDDMINFAAGLRAREAAPDIRVIMRIFEEDLGEYLQQVFYINAIYSTSAIAAPAFVSEALNIHMTQPLNVADDRFVIARLTVEPLSRLHRARIAALNEQEDLTVLLHKTGKVIHVPPVPENSLAVGDEVVVLASREKLCALSIRNRTFWRGL